MYNRFGLVLTDKQINSSDCDSSRKDSRYGKNNLFPVINIIVSLLLNVFRFVSRRFRTVGSCFRFAYLLESGFLAFFKESGRWSASGNS